jgi:hypothetical protein
VEQSQTLFSAAALITLAASLLVSAAAYVVMRFYLRAIFRESLRSASPARTDLRAGEDRGPALRPSVGHLEIQVERPQRTARPTTAIRSPTFQHAATAFRRAASVYLLGGSIHAATSVALLSALSPPSFASGSALLACYAGRFWAWSFFTLIMLALFCGPDRRIRRFLIAAYVAALPVLGVLLQLADAPSIPFADLAEAEPLLKAEAGLFLPITEAVTGSPVSLESVLFSPFSQPLVFWGLSGAPVFVPLLTFNRFVRGTVGPLFITLALMLLLTTLVINDLWLNTSIGVWMLVRIKQVSGDSTLAVMTALSFTLASVVASLGVLWIARRYRQNQLSDQTFLFDALWLSASFWVCVYLMADRRPFHYLLGMLPFALYKMTVGYGLWRSKKRTDMLPEARLLYLRVFGSARRAESLFDVLAARWRHAGSIQLISATDMARGRFEPDEFLDFLNRKLADAYISSENDLERRLATLRHRSDPDGRYRVDEFFCRADTWQRTVSTLTATSSLVIMDLRDFTSDNKGCIFELSVLVDEVPLHRVALLIDQTTDERLLRHTLMDLWERVHPGSPNAGQTARIRFVDLANGYPAVVRYLVQLGDEVIATA